MKLEEAIEIIKDIDTLDDYELQEAIETVIGELFAMQNLLDEKNEEIERLQKDSINKEKLIEIIDFGINATDSNDNYSIGMCNGMIYIKSIITDGNPNYKNCQNNEEKNTYEYGLVVGTKREREHWKDKIREKIEEITDKYNRIYKFPSQKAEETPEGKLIYSIRFNTDSEALRIVKVILEELLEEE